MGMQNNGEHGSSLQNQAIPQQTGRGKFLNG